MAIEIVSPDDRTSETLKKFEEYHHWGVTHIWLIDPLEKTFFSYDATGLHPVPTLDLPEYSFSITLADLNLCLVPRPREKVRLTATHSEHPAEPLTTCAAEMCGWFLPLMTGPADARGRVMRGKRQHRAATGGSGPEPSSLKTWWPAPFGRGSMACSQYETKWLGGSCEAP